MSEAQATLNNLLTTAYETDLYAWSMRNAGLLRERRLQEIDAQHIAEELEALARSQRRELANRLLVLLIHLLKWQYQPERRGKSWRVTIYTQRNSIEDLLDDNPSLKPEIRQLITKNYPRALRQAADETGLAQEAFPLECPWDIDQILGEYWPEK